MTGVPLKRLEDNETARLLKMEDELHKYVSASTSRSAPLPKPCARAGPV